MATTNSINRASGYMQVDPATGDSYIQFAINATNKFRIGIDDDDSDKFKISQGSALGTNDAFVVTPSGERTLPLQPTFLATHTTAQTDVTGNSAAFVTFACNNEIYDIGGGYNTSTFVYTQPLASPAMLSWTVTFSELDGNGLGQVRLRNSGGSVFHTARGHFGAMRETTGNTFTMNGAIISRNIGASGTLLVDVRITGMAGDTVDIPADGTKGYFMGTAT